MPPPTRTRTRTNLALVVENRSFIWVGAVLAGTPRACHGKTERDFFFDFFPKREGQNKTNIKAKEKAGRGGGACCAK